jgi:hypothetical protein
MKTVTEFKEAFILFTKNSECNETIYMLDRDRIETENLHETYGDWGQIVGHNTAGDYTFQNSECDAEADMLKAIGNQFTEEELETIDEDLYNTDIDDLDVSDNAKELLKKWLEENEIITTCKSLTFWDGSNYKTIVFENEHTGFNDMELEECSDEEYERIFNELYRDGEDIWECTSEKTGIRTFETENYKFNISAWQGSFANYEIEVK